MRKDKEARKAAAAAQPVVVETAIQQGSVNAGKRERKSSLPALPKLPRKRKAKEPKQCACGCGGMTKGGRFIAGHDSRLKGWLLRVERGLVKIADIPTAGERAAVEAHLAAVSK